jgi:hypothetical protein
LADFYGFPFVKVVCGDGFTAALLSDGNLVFNSAHIDPIKIAEKIPTKIVDIWGMVGCGTHFFAKD